MRRTLVLYFLYRQQSTSRKGLNTNSAGMQFRICMCRDYNMGKDAKRFAEERNATQDESIKKQMPVTKKNVCSRVGQRERKNRRKKIIQ